MLGRRHKYAQAEDSISEAPEYTVHINPSRRYSGGETDGAPVLSTLTETCSGDWSWKPARDKALGDDFITFRGVPASAAELYGRQYRS